MKKFIYALSLIFLVSGCTTKVNLDIKQVDRDGIDMVVSEDNEKVTYIKDINSTERYCAARDTDSIKTLSSGVSLGYSVAGSGDNIGEERGSNALALGGRSPAVLITRELMFRACELSMNLNTNKQETIELYKLFLSTIEKTIQNEHDTGSRSVSMLNNNSTSLKDENQDDNNQDDNDDDDDDENP